MATSDIPVNEWVRRASEADAKGQADEAARLWEQALLTSPDHPAALLNLGLHALLRKDAAKARAYLERAAVVSPRNPVIPLNLSFVWRLAGDGAREIAALDAALAIDPYFFPALLSKGAYLERIGKTRLAARVYKDALTIAPPDADTPGQLRQAVERARAIVADNVKSLEAYLNSRLAPVMDAAGSPGELARFRECRDAMTGAGRIYTQRPTLLHFPQLPAIQYYDNKQFPQLGALEAAAPVIREELINLLKEDSEGFKPYVNHPAGTPLNQWADLNFSPRWSALFLWKDGERIAENCARCPRTAALLEKADMAQTPGYAPTAFFSLLEPRTHIPPHTGVTNTRLVVHLPLIVPEGCRFRVGNDVRDWQQDEAWVFDDTIEHEAWNDSDRTRVILIFDVWNPYMTPAERSLISPLLRGIDSYYRSE
jgi:hypothetical protein